jgi:hypothetical protein
MFHQQLDWATLVKAAAGSHAATLGRQQCSKLMGAAGHRGYGHEGKRQHYKDPAVEVKLLKRPARSRARGGQATDKPFI